MPRLRQIMTSHLDFSHAISFYPHSTPIELQNNEASTQIPQSKSPSLRATSTSFEPEIPVPMEQDSVSRYSTAHNSTLADMESSHLPTYTQENDPYQLSSKLKSPSEINLIRAKTSRKRDGYGRITMNKEAARARKVQKFYEEQNLNIERWLRPVDEHIRLAKQFDGDNQMKFKIAVHGSFAANIVLAALQLYAAISSRSLSLFTTMADAIFDPMSNITLIACHRAVKKVDPRRFPSGKARIETAGNIVFCFLMTAVSFILLVLSVEELAGGSKSAIKTLHLPSVIAVATAFTTKLLLFLYCWALRNEYSQIRILWEDHRNDLFINGFGLLTSVGGSQLKWWIDPLGAIILSVLISTLWLRTAYSEFQLLIGVTADTQMQQWITYICKPPDPPSNPTPFLPPTQSPKILAPQTIFKPSPLKKNTNPPLPLKKKSNDPLPHDNRHRHCARLPQWPAYHRRSRRRHGPRRDPARHPRRCRGAPDETRELARRREGVCPYRFRNES